MLQCEEEIMRGVRVGVWALVSAIALGGLSIAGAQDAPKQAPPVVEATPAKAVDLTPLLRSLGLIGPEEKVVRVLSMRPTTDNVRDVLRLMADMAEVEVEVEGKDGKLE